MGVGDRLELVREPENLHDPLAVALRWRGEPIGYVPRRVNAQIAQLLDAGEPLLCQITRIDEQADLWERVELSIRQVPAAGAADCDAIIPDAVTCISLRHLG